MINKEAEKGNEQFFSQTVFLYSFQFSTGLKIFGKYVSIFIHI